MTDAPHEKESARAIAPLGLAQLPRQVEEARVVSVRAQQNLVETNPAGASQAAAHLLEANEQLVLATVRAQTDAETVGRALVEMSRSAQLDALTELPNRLLMLDRFAQAIANAKRHQARLALLFLDLNNFKQINDTLGHAVGDLVLKRVGQCLASLVRGVDTVSRHGGDEFLILLAEVSQASDALLVAEKLIAALGAPTRIGDHVLRLTASIGISVYPDDGEDAGALIDRADAAMYRAKRHGLGSFVYHGEQPVSERILVESLQQPLTRYEVALAEHEHRHAQLQEANEKLVLAALNAQELQGAAEKAQRRQTEFLAILAHELRNPLAPIRTAAALLGQVATEEPLLPRLQAIIERQVVHISRLVEDLLDVSRVTTGKLRLECQVVQIGDIVDEAVDACRPAMDARLQDFSVQMPLCVFEVYGDPVRLVQILSNLLDNASKYTPHGGQIRLKVTRVDDAIVLSVSDSGIGITAEALPHIFEPFVQDTTALGLNGVGLGIGLTVVLELVEAHGGKVVASSVGSGLGSQFVFSLPLIGRPLLTQK